MELHEVVVRAIFDDRLEFKYHFQIEGDARDIATIPFEKIGAQIDHNQIIINHMRSLACRYHEREGKWPKMLEMRYALSVERSD